MQRQNSLCAGALGGDAQNSAARATATALDLARLRSSRTSPASQSQSAIGAGQALDESRPRPAPRRHLTSMRAPAGAAARPAAAPARPPPRRRASTAPRAALPDLSQLLRLPGAGPAERPLFRAADAVQMGPFKVAPMGIGTWAWGNKLLWGYDESRDAELQAAFNFAVRSGANLFDTADSYGTGKLDGRAELLLGKFIAEYPGSEKVRANVRVATKLAAYPWRLAPGQWVAAARASLRRLGAEKAALVQLHWSTANYAPLQERLQWEGLAAIWDAGLCEAVGVSNYGPRQLAKIGAFLDARGIPLAAVQAQYSLLSRGPEQAALREAAGERGAAVIAYSPLALGLLSGKYSLADPASLPRGPRGLLFRQVLPGLAPLTSALEAVAAERGKTVAQVAINWAMAPGGGGAGGGGAATVPIPGAKDLAQMRENAGALGWRLDAGERAALEAAAARVPRQSQQNVFLTK